MPAEHLMIGQVVKAQGLEGEVKVKPLTDDPARFVGLRQALVQREGRFEVVPVQYVREHQGFVYLKLDSAKDRDQAEAQRGLALYVDRAHAVQLPEDHYFIVDLIGCAVEDSNGKALGTLVDVLQPGANDVYMIKGEQGTLMVPALHRVVLSTDIHAKRMVLDAQVLPEVSVLAD